MCGGKLRLHMQYLISFDIKSNSYYFAKQVPWELFQVQYFLLSEYLRHYIKWKKLYVFPTVCKIIQQLLLIFLPKINFLSSFYRYQILLWARSQMYQREMHCWDGPDEQQPSTQVSKSLTSQVRGVMAWHSMLLFTVTGNCCCYRNTVMYTDTFLGHF